MSQDLDIVTRYFLEVKDPLTVSMLTVLFASVPEKLAGVSLGFKNGSIDKVKAVTLLTITQIVLFRFNKL